MNTKRLVSSLGGITVATGLLLCALSAPVWAFGSPFAKSCLYGRYVAATTGLDVSAFESDPTTPNANIPRPLPVRSISLAPIPIRLMELSRATWL